MWAHPGVNSGQSWWPVVMAPDYAKYHPNCYGLNPGALFQLRPSPFIGGCDWTRASTGHTGASSSAWPMAASEGSPNGFLYRLVVLLHSRRW
jgi:hypothetical protein